MIESRKLPTLYIPHGGGPWNVMQDDFGEDSGYPGLRDYLVGLGKRYLKETKAILVISAHWEESRPTVHFGSRPGMLYDYGGFPDFTYSISWPAPGAPDLAARVAGLLDAAGLRSAREEKRGYDHGTFVPLMVAFPEASIPVAQLSLISGLDPAAHFDLGAALEPLRSEGILIVGSGMSYHNMGGFMSRDPRVKQVSRRFDGWLAETVAIQDPQKRREALVDWKKAPGALDCHPRSEHLVPLFVAAGAGGKDPGKVDWSASLLGVTVSSHLFGQA